MRIRLTTRGKIVAVLLVVLFFAAVAYINAGLPSETQMMYLPN